MLVCISINCSFVFVINTFPFILFTDEINQESEKIKSDKNTSTEGKSTSRLYTFSIPENYPGREGKFSSRNLYKVSMLFLFTTYLSAYINAIHAHLHNIYERDY